jgi:hypothetical protein
MTTVVVSDAMANVMLRFGKSKRGVIAEPSAEAARGRHFGFAGVNVFPGGKRGGIV